MRVRELSGFSDGPRGGSAGDPPNATALIETWAARDLLAVEYGRVSLTEAGFLLSDSLFVELL